ncbi:hypothetical protein MOSE0_A05094 [Monosporozyma servazzii]
MYLENLKEDYSKMCMSAYCADFESFIKYYDVKKLVEFQFDFLLDNYQKDYYAKKYPKLGNGPIPDDYAFDSWEEVPTWSDNLALAGKYDRLRGKYNPNTLNNCHLLTYILAYSCRQNFIFAYQLRHSGLELNELVYEAISASFIQNGYLDDYFIKVYKPLCIWYPKHPSKETCLKLLKVHEFYMYSVAYLSVIMGWEDIFVKCNIYCGFNDMYAFATFFHMDDIKQRLEKFPIIFQNVYSRTKIYTEYDYYLPSYFPHSFSELCSFNTHYGSKLNDDTFIEEDCYISYHYMSPNIDNVSALTLGHITFKNNIQFPMGKKLPFNLSNKYVAYIGDVQYYQGGDFEYAKWGALNNSIFANYVINNRENFPDYVIRNAVSNMLINGAIDEELVNKYKPFYFFNFHSVYLQDPYRSGNSTPGPQHSDCDTFFEVLMKIFPFLKANVAFGSLQSLDRYPAADIHAHPELKTDIDIISIILSKDGPYRCVEKHINQAKEQGYYYKHLDFENECNFDEPKKIPFDSVNLDDFRNKPLAAFQEGLNITEFSSVATSDPASLTDFSKLQL